MADRKLPLNRVLSALDSKNTNFYDSLNEQEKKEVSAYLLLRYASTVDDPNQDLVEYYTLSANRQANKNLFNLSKHPKLQWLLLTTISPGMGVYRHNWIPQKKRNVVSNNNVKKDLMDIYPNVKEEDLNFLSTLINKRTITQYKKDSGEK